MSLPIVDREPDSVPVLNSTPLPAFTQAWQLQPPTDALILVVKGTFDLVPEGNATPAEEQAFPSGPVPFDDAETLRYPGDTAFFKPRCDVLLVGHAYPDPEGGAVRRVSLDLGHALSYSFAAIGDRVWQDGVPSEPAAFEALPLRPERAYGGPGDANNPIGVGSHAGEGSPLPNFERLDQLIEATSDRPVPAMTTPLLDTWPERAQHTGTYGGAWVERRAPYFPDNFRWDFFQAAPPPLQIPYPVGDEWFRLIGVRHDRETLQGRLPGLRARAFAQRTAEPDTLTELTLNLDTLWFDPDQLQLTVVWRGAVEAADQFGSDLSSLFVLAEPIGQPCDEDEVRRRFVAAYEAEHVRTVEEDEPDPIETSERPEGYVPPRGLTASAARALGLPAYAATVDEPPVEPAPVPPPTPALAASALETLLESGEALGGMDLSHCDLSERDLRGRDLSGAILTGAKLDGADLSDANLRGAALGDATLVAANLKGCDLREAILDRAALERASLEGANLTDASLEQASAPEATLTGATLDGVVAVAADLARAHLEDASLVGADLSQALLEEAHFERAQMEDIRLYDARASRIVADDARMERSRLDGAVFVQGSFLRVGARDSSLRKCDLSDAAWAEAKLGESVIEDSVLDRANLNQVEARECRWPRVRANGATFIKADLMRGYFEGAELVECDFRGANLYEAETFRAKFDQCRLEHAIVGESGLD